MKLRRIRPELVTQFGVPPSDGSLKPPKGGTANALQLIVLLILLAATSAAAQQPTPQTRNDAISGRVVNEAGQPIAGASVSLDVMGASMGRRTSTDSDGNFKIGGLDGGIYRLFLYAPGYVTQSPNSSSPMFRPGDKAELTMSRGAVIAGTVTNISGEPLVMVQVRAFQIRDVDGNRVQRAYSSDGVMSDDRGYYRMWSLPAGTYVIAAGGQGQYFGSVNPFANDALTYAPASTRDTAAEIVVRSNQEANVDIRYRGDAGHAVSGKVSGVTPPPPYSPGVRLVEPDTRTIVGNAYVNNAEKTFQINGVADGEYEISAVSGNSTDGLASSARRITVRGADVTGLDLALAPMASIDARVNLETDLKLNCGRRRDTALRETVVALQRGRPEEKPAAVKDKPPDTSEVSLLASSSYDTVPNDKGDIRFRNLSAATYRFEIRLPASGWYLRDLSLAKPGLNLARNGIGLKQGEKVAGITIAITEGGASLRGRVMFSEDQSLPQNTRVYLTPAEREHADNPLRFFEDPVATDGSFAIGNVAPGKYWLIAQPAERIDANMFRSPRTDSDFRAKLLRDATTLSKEIAFKPCERNVDYEFRYPATKP